LRPLATIFGLSGPKLSRGEAAFFRDSNPWGFILFARNIETPEQLRALCASLRECVGRDAHIFIDQEGGRVRRLRPPQWQDYPSAQKLVDVYDYDRRKGLRACYLHHRLMANDLRAIGITADCAPVLDLPVKGADPIISDRAVYECSDRVSPVTISKKALTELIRGDIGFDGLLMSDDLDMRALHTGGMDGNLTVLTESALKAGCDIALQCSGKLPDMVKVAAGAKTLRGAAAKRAFIADNCALRAKGLDAKTARLEYEDLLETGRLEAVS